MAHRHVESAQAQAHMARKVALWKAAYERGDAGILAEALVRQTNVPETLKRKLREKK